MTTFSSLPLGHQQQQKPLDRRETTSGNSRKICQPHDSFNTLTCNFYDTCIEPTFQCNTDGFSLGYALPRCNSVRLFHSSNDSCQHCLQNQKLVDWILQTEHCLQPRLLELAKKFSQSKTKPDPPICLKFEKEAFQSLKSCYKSHQSSLCSLLTNTVDNSLISDLKKIVSALTIGDYYKTIVTEHLGSIIRGCSAETAETVAQTVAPKPLRVFFCATNGGTQDITNNLPIIANKLNQPVNLFSVAESEVHTDTTVKECQLKPAAGTAQISLDVNFQLIQWLAPSVSGVKQIEEAEDTPYIHQLGPSSSLVFFWYDKYETNCGNGIREAGEICDRFGENGPDENECNETCVPYSDYECSTDRLVKSFCFRSLCGDGRRTSDEECDDGNTDSNDGCNRDCKIEPNYKCSLPYNSTSKCTFVPPPISSTISSHISPTITLTATTITQSTTIALSLPEPTTTPIRTEPSNQPYSSSSHVQRLQLWSLILPLLITVLLSLLR